jgi:hypothetical protein
MGKSSRGLGAKSMSSASAKKPGSGSALTMPTHFDSER